MPLPEFSFFNDAKKIPIHLVNEVRNKFLKEIASKPNDYYEQDIDRVKSTDWQLQRFLLLKNNNVEEALKGLIEAMKWRKSFGVLDIKATDFPQELYKSAYIANYGKDLNGVPVVIIRLKVFKKSKTWGEILKRYAIYIFEKIDQNNDGKGVSVLSDTTGAGLKNIDLDFAKFTIKAAREYYPGLNRVTLVYNMIPILEPICKTIISWMNEDEKKRIFMINAKNINEYIANNELPDFIGGSNSQSYGESPSDALSSVQLAIKLGLKQDQGEKLAKYFQAFY